MDALERFVTTFREYLWSFPMLVLLFGTHLVFTFRLRLIQRKIPLGIRMSFSRDKTKARGETISSYSALATALAATIGTGNIVGISTAIAIGGPGAVFWCWITGFLGIATCYAECFLAVKFKVRDGSGSSRGGPMYVLERGLKKKGLAVAFAFFTVLASFGIGSSVQAHSIRTALEMQVNVSPHVVGIVTGVLAGLVIVGGNRQIAKVCTWLVPAMSVLYLSGCFFLILKNRAVFFEAVCLIVRSAFSPRAAAGGLFGQAVLTGMRTGISRGLFTNEAGLGSIPMAAASSDCDSPVRQGLISMTGPFWDTVVICAVTGIALVGSMLSRPEAYRDVEADRLCFLAFGEIPVCGEEILSVSLILFAFATIIGWNVYGTAAVRWLCGEAGIGAYQVVYLFFAYLGAAASLELVWGLSDLFNSFMAIPNLICVWVFGRMVTKETQETFHPARRSG